MFQLMPKHAFEYMRRQGHPFAGWVVMSGPEFRGWAPVFYRFVYIGRLITPIRRRLA